MNSQHPPTQRARLQSMNRSDTPGRVREVRARRLRHYHRSLALLEERLPGSPLIGELRDELAALIRSRAILTRAV